jgi:hypothetical protein
VSVVNLEVYNAGFTQGEVRLDNRFFWYSCKNGTQQMVELNSSGWDDDCDWVELQETCLCEAFGGEHVDVLDPKIDVTLCDGIWTEKLEEHCLYAGLCLAVLLRRGVSQAEMKL